MARRTSTSTPSSRSTTRLACCPRLAGGTRCRSFTYSGMRWPGYLSTAEGIKFSDIPGGAISSWAALPIASWFQIILFITFLEIYFLKQDPEKDAGDVVPDDWVWARYPDGYDVWLGDGSTKQVGEEELFLGKTWKLNAERNNGRAAMMGITGMLIHESLTGNPSSPSARRSRRIGMLRRRSTTGWTRHAGGSG